MDVVMFLIEMISAEIECLLDERDYCNSVDRYDEIELELKGLDWAENQLYDELDEIEYHN